MNDEEVLGSVQALYQLCGVILGKLEAVQVAQDAMAGTLVKTFPPMLEVMQSNLAVLSKAREADVQPLSLESFRNNIATIQKRLAALESD